MNCCHAEPSRRDMQNIGLDALAILAAMEQGNREAAELMLSTYTDPQEREQLYGALSGIAVNILRAASAITGIGPDKFLGAAARDIRNAL